jgi:DNA-binding MarR family transcriptional regulator
MANHDLAEVKALLAEIRLSLSALDDKLITTPTANLRETEYRLRRLRDAVFPGGYFGDAAWDILLELDRAGRENIAYVVTDAGLDAKIPHSTKIRYLTKLERDGLVARHPDPIDRRRAFICLTDKGQSHIDTVFERALIT